MVDPVPFGLKLGWLPVPRIGPGLSFVFTDVDRRPVVTSRSGIAGLDVPPFAGLNRTCYYLVTLGMLGSYQMWSRPCGAVICTLALYHG